MSLYLSESEVERIITMPLALEAVEAAHLSHGAGTAIDFPRQRSRLPATTMHMLQGALPSEGVLGYKAYTSSREGTRFQVFLFDAANGRQLAVIDADFLGMMRTGAMGGLAAKWLAREDASVVGVFGAGWQARSQIEAVCAVRQVRVVKVFARSREKLEAFCREMAQRLGREVVPAATAEEVVRGADIVVTITTTATPLFAAEWVGEGTHITAAGSNSLIRREIDEATVRLAALIVVDARATALREAGDLLPLLEKGRLHDGQLVEIGEVMVGSRRGRRNPADVTLFESQGMAIQDIALAARVLRIARDRGVGTELPF